MQDYLPTDDMNETEFEEFCYNLLGELGFVNLDWRKGTGLKSSPSDSGRDIVAQLPREEIDGRRYNETWFVDSKHHKRGVPPTKVTGLLAWAEAERADVALIVASNYLSNPCKDFLRAYETNNRPHFRIRYWERPNLQRLLEGREEFVNRYLRANMRTEAEILDAEQEFFDRVWYDRKLTYLDNIAEGAEKVASPEIMEGMRRAMRETEAKYGEETLGPYEDYEWGMINGKLSALRWVMGDDWDMLDT
jgi:Restriction endonuclease